MLETFKPLVTVFKYDIRWTLAVLEKVYSYLGMVNAYFKNVLNCRPLKYYIL